MRKTVFIILIISIILSTESPKDLQLSHHNGERECGSEYILECLGDGDCCPESWLGDGYCDNGDDCI